MRKVLVGMVVLVSTIGGISACGNKTETKRNPPAAQTPAPSVDVRKAADVKTVETSDATVKGEPLPRFTMVLGEGKDGFKFRSTMLSDEAKAKIDEMFIGDEVDPTNAHFEIEGYTDNLGSKQVNEQYGRARANAVKRYLGECYEIPADRIKVVSYGMEKPVGDNSTPEGRAKNRRVVIKVVD
jgi:peptidoglycan-associated lipoprotein